MMTRPIPRNARVGVLGALVVAALGAVLLPMAMAQTEATKSQFTATLPHDVTVELVGVCHWPDGQPVCWGPDGSTLEKPLRVTKVSVRPRPNDYGLMLRVTGPNDLELSWNTIEGSDGWEGSCDVLDAKGNRLDDYTAATALMKDGLTQTALRVGIATGHWITISSYDGKGMTPDGRAGVLWSQVFEDARGISIVATAEWKKDRTERIVALDTDGKTHVNPGGSVAAGNMDQMTTRFDGLRGAQIEEFQYQVRPYEWVEFENISLQPGPGTDTHVQWGGLGKGCDVAVESFQLSTGRTLGTYRPVVSIRNKGEAACPGIAVRFHTGDPTIDAPIHAAGPLDPGAVWCETTMEEFSPTDGVHTVQVALDPDNLVEELDETNNRVALRIVVKDGRIVEQSPVPAAAIPSGSRGNIFIMVPLATRFNPFDAVIARAEEWAWNRTGRNHSKRAYDEIFDGTDNRTDHDVLVLVFALDREERIPRAYEDLLPKPWPQIEEQLRQGQTVELSGQARGLTVILLAAPKAEQLQQVIADSRLLNNPQALLGRSGKGCDIVLESFKVRPGHIPGGYVAVVSGRNGGDAICPAFIVRFHTGDPVIDARTSGAGPLQPREIWDAGSPEFVLKEGANEVSVTLDPADLVDELNETNNQAALRIVVKDGQIVEQSAIPAAVSQAKPESVFRDYLVDRSVVDFPPGEDFSTPEAAYATINRMDRDDPSAWQKVSVARLAARMGGSGSDRQRTVDPEWAKVLANARIREVLVWNMTKAAVIAELPQEASGKTIVDRIDRRSFGLENGRWLNMGNSRFKSVEQAKAQFMGWMQRETAQADAMRDPLQHADEIKAAAAQLFEKLRTADYADILSHSQDGKFDAEGWKKFPTQGLYMVHTDYPSFALWCCTHFLDNPIVQVELGDVFIGDALVADKTGWPTVPYKLTLEDGTTLEGSLPFSYEVNQGQGHWHGMEGIDWHLWSSEQK